MTPRRLRGVPILCLSVTSCSLGSVSSPITTGYRIASLPPLLVGGSATLQVEALHREGSPTALPLGYRVAWSGPATVQALAPGSTGSLLVAPGSAPLAIFVSNPWRPDHEGDLEGTLFALTSGPEGGTQSVSARVSDARGSEVASLSSVVTLRPMPPGDPERGRMLWNTTYACATCHGVTGDGSTGNAPGVTFPAPALNDTQTPEGPALAADPAWSEGLFGMAMRADMDNQGVALRLPMPDWLKGRPSAEDCADLYAWLKSVHR